MINPNKDNTNKDKDKDKLDQIANSSDSNVNKDHYNHNNMLKYKDNQKYEKIRLMNFIRENIDDVLNEILNDDSFI